MKHWPTYEFAKSQIHHDIRPVIKMYKGRTPIKQILEHSLWALSFQILWESVLLDIKTSPWYSYVNYSVRIESIKTTSMEDVSTGVLEKIKNI